MPQIKDEDQLVDSGSRPGFWKAVANMSQFRVILLINNNLEIS